MSESQVEFPQKRKGEGEHNYFPPPISLCQLLPLLMVILSFPATPAAPKLVTPPRLTG